MMPKKPSSTTASDEHHEVIVVMTGALLASIMKENLQPGSEKEGFLFGDSSERVIRVNDDLQSDVPHQQRRVVVSNFLACGRVGDFYDAAGQLSSDSLSSLFGDGQDSLVGWYRFRRRSPCRPSLRERSIHGELLSHVGKSGLVLLLMSDDLSELVVRHDQVALVTRDGHLTPVQLQVTNMGETPGAEYRSEPFSQSLPLPAADGDSAAISTATAVHRSAHDRLHVLLERLQRSERDVDAAWREVDALKSRLAEQVALPS